MRRLAGLLILTLTLVLVSCGGPAVSTPLATATLTVTSPAFAEGGAIPAKYTAAGVDVSPPLAWGQAPAGTASFALLLEDLDAPGGIFTHWLVYNIPPTEAGFGEGVPVGEQLPNGARQGKNSFGKLGYGGPNPPPGAAHRYRFKVFALDSKLPAQSGMMRTQLLTAMQGHVLAQGELNGTYKK